MASLKYAIYNSKTNENTILDRNDAVIWFDEINHDKEIKFIDLEQDVLDIGESSIFTGYKDKTEYTLVIY